MHSKVCKHSEGSAHVYSYVPFILIYFELRTHAASTKLKFKRLRKPNRLGCLAGWANSMLGGRTPSSHFVEKENAKIKEQFLKKGHCAIYRGMPKSSTAYKGRPEAPDHSMSHSLVPRLMRR